MWRNRPVSQVLGEADGERADARLTQSLAAVPHNANQDCYIQLAREKLEETKRFIRKTEKTYEPYVAMDEIWPKGKNWEPPRYVGVFKKGEIVGYHCRNQEIDWLNVEITSLENSKCVPSDH